MYIIRGHAHELPTYIILGHAYYTWPCVLYVGKPMHNMLWQTYAKITWDLCEIEARADV